MLFLPFGYLLIGAFCAGTATEISPLDNAFFAVVKSKLRPAIHAEVAAGRDVDAVIIRRLFMAALRDSWPTLPAFFAHVGITGDPEAGAIVPPDDLQAELRFGRRPIGAPRLGEKAAAQKPGQPTASAPRRKKPNRKPQRSRRVLSLTNGDVFRIRVVDPARALLAAIARGLDSTLDSAKRRATTGVPINKRDQELEEAAIAELRRSLGSDGSDLQLISNQLKRPIRVFKLAASTAMADQSMRRIQLQRCCIVFRVVYSFFSLSCRTYEPQDQKASTSTKPKPKRKPASESKSASSTDPFEFSDDDSAAPSASSVPAAPRSPAASDSRLPLNLLLDRPGIGPAALALLIKSHRSHRPSLALSDNDSSDEDESDAENEDSEIGWGEEDEAAEEVDGKDSPADALSGRPRAHHADADEDGEAVERDGDGEAEAAEGAGLGAYVVGIGNPRPPLSQQANYCHTVSLLHCLAHLPAFSQLLLTIAEPPRTAARAVARQFHKTMTELLSSAECVNALSLFRAMMVNKDTKLLPHFNTNQQDVEEVMGALFQKLAADVDLCALVRLFEHRHQQTLTHAYDLCGHSSVKQIPGVRCVNLPLPASDATVNTSDLISEYFGGTRLKANCSGCSRRNVPQDKFIEITSVPPRCLALCFGRFLVEQVGEGDDAEMRSLKLHTVVRVETVLSYGGATYDLCSLSMHQGPTLDEGHYHSLGECLVCLFVFFVVNVI